MWLGLPLVRALKYLLFGRPGEQPQRLRFVVTISAMAAVMVTIFGFVPWPGVRTRRPLSSTHHTELCGATGAGFVAEVHVQSGQLVGHDQLLVTLRNRELSRELADLALQVRQSNIRGHQHEQQGKLAAQQAEQEQREGLLKQLAEKQAQVERLTVRARRVPVRSIAATWQPCWERILRKATRSCQLEPRPIRSCVFPISQDDLDVFKGRTGESVCIDLPRQPICAEQT